MDVAKSEKNGYLGCGCVCGPCAAIMRLGARRGDVSGVADGAAVSVQRAVSTYPAGLHDQTTGHSLEALAGMRVPYTLENIQWQHACTWCNMEEDFSKRQNALKIKPLYLTHYASYLTSNTTRVVQQQ